MLAVIRRLENWKHLLEGIKYKFKVWTDHKNLEYFMKAQKLNHRQAQQALYLSRFNFTLKHVPGTKMEKTDRPSRRLDWKIGVEKNNDNQIFIKNCWLHNLHEVVIEGLEVDIVEKIKKARSKDKEVVRVVEEIKMEVNVLDYTTRRVLFMEYEDERQKLVAFLSKSLNEIERNYEIYDKEMLAVIRRLENQRYLLEGAKFKFKVWMDYKNLEYFMKTQKLNRRQAKQTLYLLRS